jgi:hypothetical protein
MVEVEIQVKGSAKLAARTQSINGLFCEHAKLSSLLRFALATSA